MHSSSNPGGRESAWPGQAAPELARWAMATIVVRTDRYGGYGRGADGKTFTLTRPAKGPKPDVLSLDLLTYHFRGADAFNRVTPETVVGVHALSPADSTGRWLCIDIDAHDSTDFDPGANERYAVQLYRRLKALGFRVLLLSSNGKGGFHVWVFFSAAVPGAVLRAFGLWAVRDHAEHGVAAEPEVFPKQASIKPDGYGNWARLPGRHHTRDHWAQAWGGEAWLDAAGTVELILSLDGDDPGLIPLEALEGDDGGEEPTAEPAAGSNGTPEYDRPGDDFNHCGTWAETGLFAEGGATWDRQRDDDSGTVTRPGKDGGCSGTVGLVKSRNNDWPLFRCFSCNWGPFGERSYNRFAVFALLKHGGDYKAAAKALRQKGYGKDRPRGNAAPSAESKPPGVLNGTDVANGLRVVTDHGADVRFVADMGVWFVWDGVRWVVDRAETRIEHKAKWTACRMAEEAAAEVADAAKKVAAAGDDKGAAQAAEKELAAARQKLSDAKKFQDMRAIARALWAARSQPAVCVVIGRDVFDTHPHLLNCPNGTVDLRAGELRDHRREDFLTKLCPTAYNPAASRTLYLDFLGKVFHGRPRVAAYVRQLGGCVLTGEASDHVTHIAHGTGANGKSVHVGTLTRVLGEGEYAYTAPPELLMRDDRGGRHPTEKTGLRGARLVVCSETDEDAALDEAKLKELSSSDKISARYMRGDFFNFPPTHKLVLCTNHRPRVKGTDHGIWRRLRLVPYGVRFWKDADKAADPRGEYDPAFKADPGLEDRLAAEGAEGVLADMVEHAVAFYRAGRTLSPPPEVVAATNEYRKAENVIAQFFDARVRPDEQGKFTGAAFYKAFKAWWEEEGHTTRPPGPKKFGAAARAKFDPGKASTVVYRVRVLTADDLAEEPPPADRADEQAEPATCPADAGETFFDSREPEKVW